MSTQRIQYSTKSRLPCGCTPGAGVILCVSDSLTLAGDGIIYASIVSEQASQDGCNGNSFTYLFSFNDEQLAENKILNSAGIRGAFCENCLTKWVESIADSGGDDWHILGNAGTVDGTNFIGTTDEVPFTIRVNDLQVGRFQPEGEPSEDGVGPDVILGFQDNFVGTASTGGGNSILGGGRQGNVNSIGADDVTDCRFDVICGGFSNVIENTVWAFIGAGRTNTITQSTASGIVAAIDSSITESDGSFIGVGGSQVITGSEAGFIGGGNTNQITRNSTSSIVGGGSNEITSGEELPGFINFIGGGFSNVIENSIYSIIGAGALNSILSGQNTTISGGGNNNIIETPQVSDENFYGFSTIAGGYFGLIDCAGFTGLTNQYCNNVIGGGVSQIVQNTNAAVIAGGYANIIRYSNLNNVDFRGPEGDTVGGGLANIIADAGPVTDDQWINIGQGNTISGGNSNGIENSSLSTISGGFENFIQPASLVLNPAGYAQNFGPVTNNSIVGGSTNGMIMAQAAFIGGGSINRVYGENSSLISGGFTNTIKATTPVPVPSEADEVTIVPPDSLGICNAIVGGAVNYIEDGKCSSILGGAFLKIGEFSTGFQGGATRDFSTLDAAPTPQVDVSAFSSLAYFGDVDIWVANTNNDAAKVKFIEPNTDLDFSSANYSSFEAQAQAANIEYVLPATAGTPGQVLTIQGVVGTVVTLEWA